MPISRTKALVVLALTLAPASGLAAARHSPLPGRSQAAFAGARATPISPAAAGSLQPLLLGLASAEAPGMRPEGAPFAAQFAEGQTLEQAVNVQSGKCYTVLGVGTSLKELDVQIVLRPSPPLPPFVAAQDSSSGPNAILGGKASGCFKNPLPVSGPATIIVRATRGAGVAVAQLYVK